MGETHAILALSGNITLLKLLLNAMAKGLNFKNFADSFISFGGILCMPVDFLLSIFLKSCLHHKRKPLEGGCFPL